jgi:hypothetical protein
MIQHGTPHFWVWADGYSKLNLSGQVVSFSYSKRLEQVAGHWSVTLMPTVADQGQPIGSAVDSAALMKLLRPNTVVSLGYDRPGGIMVGLVDEVREGFRGRGAQVGHTLEVRGRDMGKALENDSLVFASVLTPEFPEFSMQVRANLGDNAPILRSVLGITAPEVGGAPTFLNVGVAEVVKWVLENTPTMQIPAMSQTGALATGRIGEWLDVGDITTWHDAKVWSDNLDRREGSIISIIKAALDEDFYEVIVGSTPTAKELPRATLTIRPKPYDEAGFRWAPTSTQPGSDWPGLRPAVLAGYDHHVVKWDRVFEASLGFSDSDVFSHYMVTADHELIGNPGAEAEGLKYPLIDLYAAQKYGIRPYNSRMALVAADMAAKVEGNPSQLVTEVADARNRLFNWYRPNPWMETGSIVMLGDDNLRVGDPLLLADRVSPMTGEKGVRYYVVGVDLSWSRGQHYVATVQVTRGHTPGLGKVISKEVAAKASFGNPDFWTAA